MNKFQLISQQQLKNMNRQGDNNISPIYLEWFNQNNQLRAGTAPTNNIQGLQKCQIQKSSKQMEMLDVYQSPNKQQKTNMSIQGTITQQQFKPKQFFSKIIQDDSIDSIEYSPQNRDNMNYDKLMKDFKMHNKTEQIGKLQNHNSLSINEIEKQLSNISQGNRPLTSMGGQRIKNLKNEKLPNLNKVQTEINHRTENLYSQKEKIAKKKNIGKIEHTSSTPKINFQNQMKKDMKQKKQNYIKNIYLNHLKKPDDYQKTTNNTFKIIINKQKNQKENIQKNTLDNTQNESLKSIIGFQSNLDLNFIQLFGNNE